MDTREQALDVREKLARAMYFAAEGVGAESWFLPENDAHWERWKNDGDAMSPSPLTVADAIISAFPALAAPSAPAQEPETETYYRDDEPLTPQDQAMIDQAWENHKAALPVATVINNNQPGRTAIIEITIDPPTLDVGTKLYAEPKRIEGVESVERERDALRYELKVADTAIRYANETIKRMAAPAHGGVSEAEVEAFGRAWYGELWPDQVPHNTKTEIRRCLEAARGVVPAQSGMDVSEAIEVLESFGALVDTDNGYRDEPDDCVVRSAGTLGRDYTFITVGDCRRAQRVAAALRRALGQEETGR